jgi:hypothetical protein
MEVDTSKRLPMLALAGIPFNVKQNRCTKELGIVLHPGRQSMKTVVTGRRPNNGNHAFLIWIFYAFRVGTVALDRTRAESWGIRNGTTTHHQFINVRSLSLWHGARPEEISGKT